MKSGDPKPTGGRTFGLVVEVPSRRRAVGTAEPAPEVGRAERAAVWAGWLAEGRYRSLRELAEAVGVSAACVSRVLKRDQ